MQMHYDMRSPSRQGRWLLLRLTAVIATAFAVAAATAQFAPAADSLAGDPSATAAATKCVAKIQKGDKYVTLRETYYAYAYRKIKGSKKYKKVVVKKRRAVKTSCVRSCVRTKKKKGKRVPVYKMVRKKVKVKKGNKIVTAKKRVRVYTYEKCKNLGGNSTQGTPVKVTLLKDSKANLDFGAFQRTAPLTGDLGGFIPGGYQLGQDNLLNFTRGNIGIDPTDVFIDDDCKGGKVSPAIRTGSPAKVLLDPTRNSTSQILASGTVTATIYTVIQLPLALRNDDDGCDSPYITTGYSEFKKTFFFRGKIDKATGLAKLLLKAPTEPLDVVACLSPGVPTSPCNGFQIPLPIIVSVDAVVSIKVG